MDSVEQYGGFPIKSSKPPTSETKIISKEILWNKWESQIFNGFYKCIEVWSAQSQQGSEDSTEDATTSMSKHRRSRKRGRKSNSHKKNEKTSSLKETNIRFTKTIGKSLNVTEVDKDRKEIVKFCKSLVSKIHDQILCLITEEALDKRIRTLYPDISTEEYNFAQLCILLTSPGLDRIPQEYNLTDLYVLSKKLVWYYILVKAIITDRYSFWRNIDLKKLTLGTLLYYSSGSKFFVEKF